MSLKNPRLVGVSNLDVPSLTKTARGEQGDSPPSGTSGTFEIGVGVERKRLIVPLVKSQEGVGVGLGVEGGG